MSLTVPASPVSVELCSTDTARPVTVRAHARALPERTLAATPWQGIYLRQRARMYDALARYQAQAWRSLMDPIRERAWERLCAEMAALDALGSYQYA